MWSHTVISAYMHKKVTLPSKLLMLKLNYILNVECLKKKCSASRRCWKKMSLLYPLLHKNYFFYTLPLIKNFPCIQDTCCSNKGRDLSSKSVDPGSWTKCNIIIDSGRVRCWVWWEANERRQGSAQGRKVRMSRVWPKRQNKGNASSNVEFEGTS